MDHIKGNLRVDKNLSILNFQKDIASYTVSATPINLSESHQTEMYFSGTTSGQVVNLGDATTYSNGHEYWMHNRSTKPISVEDYGSTELVELIQEKSIKIR